VTTGPGRALAVGFEGTRIPDDLVALAEQAGLGGVVLFARNCPSLEAVLALTAAARKLGPDVLILVDHEGGQVHRLPSPFTRFPPPAAVGRSGDPHLAVAVARAMARELRAAGFDSGLAPVLDCLLNPANMVIGDRAFGTAPDVVAACGVAFVEAMLSEGLVPVAKHFPGHGRTSAGVPRLDTRRWRRLAGKSTEARSISLGPCSAAKQPASSSTPPDHGPTSRSSAAPSIAPSPRKWFSARLSDTDATAARWSF